MKKQDPIVREYKGLISQNERGMFQAGAVALTSIAYGVAAAGVSMVAAACDFNTAAKVTQVAAAVLAVPAWATANSCIGYAKGMVSRERQMNEYVAEKKANPNVRHQIPARPF